MPSSPFVSRICYTHRFFYLFQLEGVIFFLIGTVKLAKVLRKVRLTAKGAFHWYSLFLQTGTQFMFALSLPAERGQLHHSI